MPNTGYSPALFLYYQYWERLIYNAITEMAVRSMAGFMGLLTQRGGKDSAGAEGGGGGMGVGGGAPMIKVVVSMNG